MNYIGNLSVNLPKKNTYSSVSYRINNGCSFKETVYIKENSKNPMYFLNARRQEVAQKNPYQETNYLLNNFRTEEGLSYKDEITKHIIRILPVSGSIAPPSLETKINADEFVANQKFMPDFKLKPEYRILEQISEIMTNNISYEAGKSLETEFPVEIEKLYEQSLKVKENTSEFVNFTKNFYEFMAQGATFELNTDRLKELAQSDEATIFITRHAGDAFDLARTMGFVSKLYEEYEKNENPAIYPKMNYTILKRKVDSFPDKLRAVALKAGLVGLDSTAYPTKEKFEYNKIAKDELVDDFIKNKSHIFMFPEGARYDYRDKLKPLDRFQYGISKIIVKSARKKKRVKIVTLGMDKRGGLYIGKPLYFENRNGVLYVSKGNFTTDSKIAQENSFFRNLAKTNEDELKPITYGGKEIKDTDAKGSKALARLASGIISEDLEISMNTAEKLYKNLQHNNLTDSYYGDK